MNISLLDAGNAGSTHTYNFSEAPHKVALIKTSESLHEQIK